MRQPRVAASRKPTARPITAASKTTIITPARVIRITAPTRRLRRALRHRRSVAHRRNVTHRRSVTHHRSVMHHRSVRRHLRPINRRPLPPSRRTTAHPPATQAMSRQRHVTTARNHPPHRPPHRRLQRHRPPHRPPTHRGRTWCGRPLRARTTTTSTDPTSRLRRLRSQTPQQSPRTLELRGKDHAVPAGMRGSPYAHADR